MPYKVRKSGKGYKVANKETGKTYSKKPLSKEKADAQMRAIYANTNESVDYKKLLTTYLKVLSEVGKNALKDHILNIYNTQGELAAYKACCQNKELRNYVMHSRFANNTKKPPSPPKMASTDESFKAKLDAIFG